MGIMKIPYIMPTKRESIQPLLYCVFAQRPSKQDHPHLAAEMMFGETMQSNLPTVNITEKDKACRREQWKRQYNERSHTLKYLNRGQSVRVQDYTTKKWEPAMINQERSQPISYMLTTNTGSQYRINRRHIRTTTEVFKIPERHHDESATRDPTVVNRAERPTC